MTILRSLIALLKFASMMSLERMTHGTLARFDLRFSLAHVPGLISGKIQTASMNSMHGSRSGNIGGEIKLSLDQG